MPSRNETSSDQTRAARPHYSLLKSVASCKRTGWVGPPPPLVGGFQVSPQKYLLLPPRSCSGAVTLSSFIGTPSFSTPRSVEAQHMQDEALLPAVCRDFSLFVEARV